MLNIGWGSGAASAAVRVALAEGGHYPQAFWWRGRYYRVRGLESLVAVGHERRYRLDTAEGSFELAHESPAGGWRVRHAPGWLWRAWARWQNAPRYPLPGWRRRLYRPAPALNGEAARDVACGGKPA